MTFQHPLNLHHADPAEVRLAKALTDLENERKAVGKIQRSLLPATLPQIPGFEMSPYYRPSEHAGGDYYDVVPLIDGQWGFVMADVAGHGIPAAIIMTVLRTLIHAELPSNRDKSAGKFLQHVNRVMSETCLRDGRFVTMWAAVLDPASRRLTYACAGHNSPRLLRGGRVFELGAPGGIPLGIDPGVTYENVCITLEPEDLLVIYTDGITEAMRPGIDGRELFGTARLDRVLSECGSDRTSDCTERVTKAIAAFTDDRAPTDDRTMLIVRAGALAPRISRNHNGTPHIGLVTKEPLTLLDQKEKTHERDYERRWHANLFQGLGASKTDCRTPARRRGWLARGGLVSGRERTAIRTLHGMPLVHALVPGTEWDAMRNNTLRFR
jgi:serine phosphatase RsbU (regulator of sigma subunit)